MKRHPGFERCVREVNELCCKIKHHQRELDAYRGLAKIYTDELAMETFDYFGSIRNLLAEYEISGRPIKDCCLYGHRIESIELYYRVKEENNAE